MNVLTARRARAPKTEWWRGASIYQIYPRSFADRNGDGVGDLPGITDRLDYVADLGVDAIWLSPFFKSPMADFGYDVADYCDVDPLFGSLADFDALISKAHRLGLKVIIDQVWSHTSDMHPWFVSSRAARNGPKTDWYVWADPKADGSPPNNWQSVFGGPAWTWDARRCQYYMHNFLSAQPQLNVNNAEVQDALLAAGRFWLDRGVDGFRLDAINFAMHDPRLTDNPPALGHNAPRTRPFDFQLHVHNQSQPEMLPFLERISALMREYEGRFTVAEVGGANADREMKLFTAGGRRLDSAYGFNFLYAAQLTPGLVREALENWPDDGTTGWPSWAFENHDAPRAISRWAGSEDRERFLRLKMLLLACLRGNIFLYYGEELGLPQVEIAYEDLRDPEAIANWPLTLSRDGARTPMPWKAGDQAMAFTTGKPWLPLGEEHRQLAVDRQMEDQHSMLLFTKKVLAFRQSSPALLRGAIEFRQAEGGLLTFERRFQGERLLCAFNLGLGTEHTGTIDEEPWEIVFTSGDVGRQSLGPHSALVARLS